MSSLKNPAVERLAAEKRRDAVVDFLKDRVWPTLPEHEVGRVLTRAEEDAILGYGPDGPVADMAGDDPEKTDRPVATLRGSATARPRMTTDEILALTRR
ncbi:MAG: hypothetical protein KAY59_04505 [Acidobacteria bacterium]|nr:hypothetical protein [Acidobacteriota bacterium]